MSLFLGYHAANLAVCTSDDLATTFAKERLDMSVPKFGVYDGLVLGHVGRKGCVEKLQEETRRLVEQSQPRFLQLAASLPHMLRKIHAERTPLADILPSDDRLHACLLGFDPAAWRVRCFVFMSDNDFKEIETTREPSNRVVALGAFDLSGEHILEDLTGKMRKARGPAWIAAQLRDAVNALSEKYPKQIGKASYYAAIGPNGAIELPGEFSRVELEVAV